MMIESILESAFAPFLSQTGWQGFAYGLLGLKMVRKMIHTVRSTVTGNDNEEDNNE